MPYHDYLRGPSDSFYASSIVFDTTDGDSRERPAQVVHAGIALEHKPTHRLNDPTRVIHMVHWVDECVWRHGIPSRDGDEDKYRVDGCGWVEAGEPDDVVWIQILDEAKALLGRSHELLSAQILGQERAVSSLFWVGPPSLSTYPHHGSDDPDVRLYALSCATFVYHCYTKAWPRSRFSIDIEAMPEIDPQTRDYLRTRMTNPAAMPAGPFRVLYAGYLIGALQSGEIPFRPANWGAYQR